MKLLINIVIAILVFDVIFALEIIRAAYKNNNRIEN